MPGESPFWEQWLLDNPWPLGACLLLVGAVLAFNAIRRQRRRELNIAIVAAALGLVVLIVGNLVPTDRKRLASRTRELVNLTAPLNLPELTAMFEPDAPLLGPDGAVWVDGHQLLSLLENRLKTWRINWHWIREVRAQAITPSDGVSTVLLRSEPKGSPYPGGTSTFWLIRWHHDPDGQWRVASIQWLKWENREPAEELLHMGRGIFN